MVSVKPGTLDDTSTLTPDRHIWTESKQPWITIPENMEAHEKTLPDGDVLPSMVDDVIRRIVVTLPDVR